MGDVYNMWIPFSQTLWQKFFFFFFGQEVGLEVAVGFFGQ